MYFILSVAQTIQFKHYFQFLGETPKWLFTRKTYSIPATDWYRNKNSSKIRLTLIQDLPLTGKRGTAQLIGTG